MNPRCLVLLVLLGCTGQEHPVTTRPSPAIAVLNRELPPDPFASAGRAMNDRKWLEAAHRYEALFAGMSIENVYKNGWEYPYINYIISLLELGKSAEAYSLFSALYAHQRRVVAHPIPYPIANALVLSGQYRGAFHKYTEDMIGPVRGDNVTYVSQTYLDTGADTELRKGLAEAQSGSYTQAIKEWQSAVRDSPYFQEPHYLSAIAYLALGRRANALSEFVAVTQVSDQTYIGEPQPQLLQLGALRMIFGTLVRIRNKP